MSKAMIVHATGGPDVLRWEDRDVGAPGPGEIRVRQAAVGVNFIDVYFRTGLYKAPSMPFVPGKEGAGTVEALGEGVSRFSVGDRVAYNDAPGAYAEEILLKADSAVLLP